MNHESAAFMNSKKKFGFLKSEAQLKEEVFIGPKIQKLLLDNQFTETLNSTELNACKSFNARQNLRVPNWDYIAKHCKASLNWKCKFILALATKQIKQRKKNIYPYLTKFCLR